MNKVVTLIRERYKKAGEDYTCRSLIYTRAGPVVVAMNPFTRDLADLYDLETAARYHEDVSAVSDAPLSTTSTLPPHIYEISAKAYYGVRQGKSQAIVINGESGAGKTETAKLLLADINERSKSSASGDGTTDLVKKLSASNPLLEAFGNAKTVRNNNSSRFGKFTKLIFSRAGLDHASVQHYLLEKSRVVHQTAAKFAVGTNVMAPGEQGFHAFYYLLKCAPEALREELNLHPESKERPEVYVSLQPAARELSKEYSKEWEEVNAALTELLGCDSDSDERVRRIWRVLAAVLHLGQITFETADDKGVDSGSKVADGSVENLKSASTLLGCEAAELTQALCERTLLAQKLGLPLKKRNQSEAANARSTLAKGLYERLFSYLIGMVNNALNPDGAACGSQFIGLLDIFGSEVFPKNGYEQLLINYANDKLHWFFTQSTIKLVMDEYKREGIIIDIASIEERSILPTLQLLEGDGSSPNCILGLLNDDAILPLKALLKENESSRDERLFKTMCDKFGNGKSKSLFTSRNGFRGADGKLCEGYDPKKWRLANFAVEHFGGVVPYCVDSFCEKNQDFFDPDLDLTHFMREHAPNGKSAFVQELFSDAVGSSATSRSIALKFKEEMAILMEILTQCQGYFIRCIKPNEAKQPFEFGEDSGKKAGLVEAQLKSCGVLEAAKVSQVGYPVRRTFDEFLRQFMPVQFGTLKRNGDSWTVKVVDDRGYPFTIRQERQLTNEMVAKLAKWCAIKMLGLIEVANNEGGCCVPPPLPGTREATAGVNRLKGVMIVGDGQPKPKPEWMTQPAKKPQWGLKKPPPKLPELTEKMPGHFALGRAKIFLHQGVLEAGERRHRYITDAVGESTNTGLPFRKGGRRLPKVYGQKQQAVVYKQVAEGTVMRRTELRDPTIGCFRKWNADIKIGRCAEFAEAFMKDEEERARVRKEREEEEKASLQQAEEKKQRAEEKAKEEEERRVKQAAEQAAEQAKRMAAEEAAAKREVEMTAQAAKYEAERSQKEEENQDRMRKLQGELEGQAKDMLAAAAEAADQAKKTAVQHAEQEAEEKASRLKRFHEDVLAKQCAEYEKLASELRSQLLDQEAKFHEAAILASTTLQAERTRLEKERHEALEKAKQSANESVEAVEAALGEAAKEAQEKLKAEHEKVTLQKEQELKVANDKVRSLENRQVELRDEASMLRAEVEELRKSKTREAARERGVQRGIEENAIEQARSEIETCNKMVDVLVQSGLFSSAKRLSPERTSDFWLKRGNEVNAMGRARMIEEGEQLSAKDRVITKVARHFMLHAASVAEGAIIECENQHKAPADDLYRNEFKAYLSAANMTRKLDASASIVEYDSAIKRIEEHDKNASSPLCLASGQKWKDVAVEAKETASKFVAEHRKAKLRLVNTRRTSIVSSHLPTAFKALQADPHPMKPFKLNLLPLEDVRDIGLEYSNSDYKVNLDLPKLERVRTAGFANSSVMTNLRGLTLPDEVRAGLHIPKDATLFAWVFPLRGALGVTDLEPTTPEEKAVVFGGYAYFKDADNLLALNAVDMTEDGKLSFEGPCKFDDRSCVTDGAALRDALEEKGLLWPVTIPAFKELGIEYFWWLGPGEDVAKEDGNKWPNGAFAYLYGAGAEHMNCFLAIP